MTTAKTPPASRRPDRASALRPDERHALDRLSRTHGLAHVRLNPHNDELQLVGYDGKYLGRIRLVGPRSSQPRWNAVPDGHLTTLGSFTNANAAAMALARDAGIAI